VNANNPVWEVVQGALRYLPAPFPGKTHLAAIYERSAALITLIAAQAAPESYTTRPGRRSRDDGTGFDEVRV